MTDRTLPKAKRLRALTAVSRVLDTACQPDSRRRERACLGYYLSPGTGSWDSMVEAESVLLGTDHAITARSRFLEWQAGGSPSLAPTDQGSILDAWCKVVEDGELVTLVPTKDDGLVTVCVVDRVGAWAVTQSDGVAALTWGPTGLAADVGALDVMLAHLDALGRFPEHSVPGLGGNPWKGADLIRERLAKKGAA